MRACSRTIDRPLLILGLEGEDVALLMVIFGVPAILFAPVIPLVCFFIAWPGLVMFKRGKPEGYVLHWLYKAGLPFKGLLPPGARHVFAPYTAHEMRIE
ncbi:MAG: hypothetical protein HQL19_07220 [Candidatus Omnitrophica bacterium]|nr:hypothetical protein [Candidatus Omnitrophota bacterium]